MTAHDLPAVATPWTDPLGNVWCCVPSAHDGQRVVIYELIVDDAPLAWEECNTRNSYDVAGPLLKGLGRTLPPVPTPKRVAKLVTRSDGAELAVKGDKLFYRRDRSPWKRYSEMLATMDFVAAAHAAFAGAGDVLPGEIPDA